MEQQKPLTTMKCNSPTHVPKSTTFLVNNNNQNKKRIIIVDEKDQKKKKVEIKDYHIILQVTISRAMGIDEPRIYPYINRRNYNVVYWVEPGEEVHTKMSEGVIPIWNHEKAILLNNFDVDNIDNAFLNVEVQRLNSKVDPGTSCGRVVVGRAKIPLPKIFGQQERGIFPLLRTEGNDHKFEGSIIISVRLGRMRIDSTHFSLPMGFGRS